MALGQVADQIPLIGADLDQGGSGPLTGHVQTGRIDSDAACSDEADETGSSLDHVDVDADGECYGGVEWHGDVQPRP